MAICEGAMKKEGGNKGKERERRERGESRKAKKLSREYTQKRQTDKVTENKRWKERDGKKECVRESACD
jgi:hypothetical protein